MCNSFLQKTISFFLLCALCAACTTKSKDESKENQANSNFLQTVKTAKATLSNQEQALTLTGKVEYDPDKVIMYQPLLEGVVTQTYFSLGDKVQKGQVMFEMHSTAINAMQSELISSQAELRSAEREYQSAQALYDDQMLSEKELLEAQSNFKQAQASYARSKKDLALFGAGNAKGTYSVKAPMSGYVVEKRITTGSTILTDNEPLFTIADLSKVWVVVNVYANNLAAVREGMEVEVHTLSYKDEVFTGKIDYLSPVFDAEEKVLKARISMENTDLKLKPEMSALVTLKETTLQQPVTIPSEALIFDRNTSYVVVENAPGSYSIREVIPQGHHEKVTYIASGLAEGECVVVKNQLLIYSGLKEE